MKQITLAALLYAGDNDDLFPRSQHSAFANGQLPWERAITPGLGATVTTWTNLLNGLYHCPADQQPAHLSYGMNYYFELGPEDDYPEQPQTWRKLSLIVHPANTVFFTEVLTDADHVMPALSWATVTDAEADVAWNRHGRKIELHLCGWPRRIVASHLHLQPAASGFVGSIPGAIISAS